MCTCVCMSVCTCFPCEPEPTEVRRSVSYPETEVKEDGKPPCGCCQLNLDPLQEQPVLSSMFVFLSEPVSHRPQPYAPLYPVYCCYAQAKRWFISGAGVLRVQSLDQKHQHRFRGHCKQNCRLPLNPLNQSLHILQVFLNGIFFDNF